MLGLLPLSLELVTLIMNMLRALNLSNKYKHIKAKNGRKEEGKKEGKEREGRRRRDKRRKETGRD